MASLNKVMLIGNLGKDPEVKHFENGVAKASFSVATTETYTDKNTGQKVDKTEWHNVVMWRGLAEVAEKFLSKGKQVYIEGRIETRSYDDKDGVKKYITEIVADEMQMLGKKEEGTRNGSSSYAASFSQSVSDMPPSASVEDDLPF